MSRFLKETRQFKIDKKRVKKSGRYDWEKMRAIVRELMNDRPLDAKHRDHASALGNHRKRSFGEAKSSVAKAGHDTDRCCTLTTLHASFTKF